MKDRPIIFSAPMVRAMLDGRKTKTRRLLKGVPPEPADDSEKYPPKHERAYFDAYCGGKKTRANPRGMTEDWCWWTRANRCGNGCKVRYLPGDRLYVREAWSHSGIGVWTIADARRMMDGNPLYRATNEGFEPLRWWPSIHMPREFSRLTLLVESVRVERLQEISDTDAEAEGVPECPSCDGVGWINSGPDGGWQCTARGCGDSYVDGYHELWDTLHTKPGERWEDNPWIVALTFEVLCGNIDKHPTSTGEGDGR